MKDKDLAQQLENLRKKISEIDEQDETLRAQMQELAKTIQRKLDHPVDPDKHSETLEGMKKAVIDFKVKHPRISAEIERLLDMLNNLGM